MPLFRRSSRSGAPQLRFQPGDFAFVSDEGERVHGVGFNIHDDHDRAFSHDDDVLISAGIHIFKVAGVSYRLAELRGPGCEAGMPILLVPEPENQYDPNAVTVWTGDRRTHLGYVPRDTAAPIAAALREQQFRSFILWEWLGEDGQRSGLTVLACPPAALANSRGLP